MKNYLRLLFVSVLVCVVTNSSAQAKEPDKKAVSLAPDFTLQDLSQNKFSLRNYRYKQPVVLFFWTTWCPFCREELRTLKELYPKLTKEGWELFAINIEEPAYIVTKAVTKYDLNFKVLLDLDTTVAHAYNILGVPTYILVNIKGQVVFRDHYFPQKEYKELISEKD